MSTATASPLTAYRDQPALLRKAIDLVEAGRVRHVEGGHEYLVTGSDGVTRYLADAYRQTCDCTAGRFGRRCYHLAAAIAMDEGRGR